jgi:hypothetical protein
MTHMGEKPEEERALGSARCRWKDKIKVEHGGMGCKCVD